MKKLIMLLVLSLLFGLMGCGPREPSTEETTEMEQTTELTTELMPASADAVSTEEINVQAETKEQEEQIAVLVKERGKWLSHYEFEDADAYEDNGYEDIGYTIADLNQNGQLEIIVKNVCSGSGMFIYYYVYEVTPEGTIEEWQFKGYEEGMSHMSIVEDRMTVYYNEEEGTYSYLCEESTGGVGGIGSNPGVIVINGKTIEEKRFACSWFDDYKYGMRYLGADKNEITKKEYDKLVKEATPKGKKGNAYFGWESKSLEELLHLSKQKMKKDLTKLSKEFVIRLEQKSDKKYNKQIQYLVSQKKEWMKLLPKELHVDNETDEAHYEFMAMDLNRNGCMELWIKYTGGLIVFEVNKEGDGMMERKCTGEVPDIPFASAYRSVKDDAIHIVDFDEYGVDLTKLIDTVLTEGQLKTNLISLADETGNGDASTNYYNGQNEKITKQEYDNLNASFYKDLTQVKFYVEPIISPDDYYFDFKSLNEITDEELTDRFQEGIECFYIG